MDITEFKNVIKTYLKNNYDDSIVDSFNIDLEISDSIFNNSQTREEQLEIIAIITLIIFLCKESNYDELSEWNISFESTSELINDYRGIYSNSCFRLRINEHDFSNSELKMLANILRNQDKTTDLRYKFKKTYYKTEYEFRKIKSETYYKLEDVIDYCSWYELFRDLVASI